MSITVYKFNRDLEEMEKINFLKETIRPYHYTNDKKIMGKHYKKPKKI